MKLDGGVTYCALMLFVARLSTVAEGDGGSCIDNRCMDTALRAHKANDFAEV